MWIETDDNKPASADAATVDLSFHIQCAELPVDHAQELAAAICTMAPWFDELPHAGVHPIHVAGSQNGWERPAADAGESLKLSRRTRLRIRIEKSHQQRLKAALENQSLSVAGFQLQIRHADVRSHTPASTLFARHVAFRDNKAADSDEQLLIDRIISDCAKHGYRVTKLLCGKHQTLSLGGQVTGTRSVLLADVPPTASLTLQDIGLGDWRTQGCGLLVPHKGIAAVHGEDT